jgi:hypothetical protein
MSAVISASSVGEGYWSSGLVWGVSEGDLRVFSGEHDAVGVVLPGDAALVL